MARRDERIAQARELERTDQLASALDLYRQAAEEADPSYAAVLRARMASLHLRGGDQENARTELLRAADLFVSSGHRNNALALYLELVDRDPSDAAAALKLLEISLACGYPEFARSALRLLARASSAAAPEIAADAASIIERAVDEDRFATGLASAALRETSEDGIALLEAVWRILSDRGASGAASRVRAEILALDPARDPEPPPTPIIPEPAGPSTDLPLLEPDPIRSSGPEVSSIGPDRDDLRIAPLAGFEPTHADPEAVDALSSHFDEFAAEQAPDAGRFDDRTEDRTPDFEDAAPDDEFEDDDDPEPLPLLSPTDFIMAPMPARELHAEERVRYESRPRDHETGVSRSSQGPPEEPSLEEVPLDNASGPPEDERATTGAPAEAGAAVSAMGIDVKAIADELASLTGRTVEPADPTSHYDVGVAFKEMGMVQEAVAQLVAALRAGYNPLATLEIIGEILIDQGKDELAARLLRHVVAGRPADDEQMVGVLYWLGRSEEALGNRSEALRLLGRVVEVAPTFRDAARRLADQSRSGL